MSYGLNSTIEEIFLKRLMAWVLFLNWVQTYSCCAQLDKVVAIENDIDKVVK